MEFKPKYLLSRDKNLVKAIKSFLYITASLWIILISIFTNTSNSRNPDASASSEQEGEQLNSTADIEEIPMGEVAGIKDVNIQDEKYLTLETASPTPTLTPTSTTIPTAITKPTKAPTIKPSVSQKKIMTPTPSKQTFNNDTPQSSIAFSGYNWVPEDSGTQKWGPGPNYWSPSRENIFIDNNGYLNLKVRQEDGKWYCPNIATTQSLGYGKYTFTFDKSAFGIDDNMVFGAFLYDERSATADAYNKYHREIDMLEVSRWSNSSYPNFNFTVWNTDNVRNREFAYEANPNANEFTVTMTWSAGKIEIVGPPKIGQTQNVVWTYTTDIPVPGQTQFRFNLWIHESSTPNSNTEQTVKVKNFSYSPS